VIEMESKQMRVAAEIKASAEGVIEGYGSVFGNVDSYGDIVVAGAFDATLKSSARLPAMLWQHSADEPIGVWTEMREDKRGLVVKGQLALGTQRGREALELIKLGALSGLSIGYRTVRSSFDEQSGLRSLHELELWEVSPVTFPANEAARITSAKSAWAGVQTVRDFETFLRAAGVPRGAAESIAKQGFKATQGEPAADPLATQGEPAASGVDADLLAAIEALRVRFTQG
jgi:HK97 family phage prohead protease